MLGLGATASIAGWLAFTRHGLRRAVSGALTVGCVAALGIIAVNLPDKAGGTPGPASTGVAFGSSAAADGGKLIASPDEASYNGGWGPERQTFTDEAPANYAVIDSITDDPDIGDERNFFRIKSAQAQGPYAQYGDLIRAKPGDEVVVSVALFNNAADNLDSLTATIHGLNARLVWSSPGKVVSLGAVLSSANTITIWDGASIVCEGSCRLDFISGSATLRTNAGDFPVSDLINSDKGAPLGYDKTDGEFPVGYAPDGKYRGNGYVNFRVRVSAS